MLPPSLKSMINLGLWSSLVRQRPLVDRLYYISGFPLVEIVGGPSCILMLIPMVLPINQITFGCFLVRFTLLGCDHIWFTWCFAKRFQISINFFICIIS
jgi:hypothetical protein